MILTGSIMLPVNRAIKVDVIGCGGTGSQVLTGLARIHNAIKSCGHQHGLFVRAYDPDRVGTFNVGRQLFHMNDVGEYKAECLIRRLNLFYGAHWNWMNSKWAGDVSADLVMVCIDTGVGREQIERLSSPKRQYIMDCGNERDFGQVILGGMEYPSPYEDHPALKTKFDDDGPSCSLAESLNRQDLFINQAIATHALNIVWKMVRYGSLDYRGVFVNLKSGITNPIKTNGS